ncbi:ATP-binding protein [Roseomonas haemaphysalidis]|uniref:histidine kinase n=1 Tax=Roseomonas haemaphysalidis TaxID=2768162 RepID=A0ABS3KIX1_9PROT|nr:ATP-binding protein [Roseomonas haemaphysalidis]MBO1077414.1 response regulator [Roseomonas haemaphysalidis]
MQFHTPTLLIVSTLLAAVLGLMWLGLAWHGSRVRGVGYWGSANLLFAVGAALGGARDMLPDFLSIDLSNALMLVATGACWTAARRFDDRPARLGWALAGAALWLLLRRLPELTETVEARIVIASSTAGLYILLTGWEFSRRRADMMLFRGIVVASFLLHGTLVMIRALSPLGQQHWTVTSALPSGGWFGIAVVEAMLHVVLTSFALLAMIREREQQRAVAEIAASRDAADRANAAKSRFLARMSHELRTPLNGVLGLAQILAADRGLPAGTRDHGSMIERAGRHLLALVNDVLDLSQVEAGKLAFDEQPVPLARLLDSAAVLLNPEAARKRIHLEVALAPLCPQVVLGDELRLRQVLLNLLGNAVKFTPEGGAVRLELMPLAPHGVRVEVTDTGPGIPRDQRSLLFRDFSRMPKAGGGEPMREGNGLGLAISAGLVEGMGGQIGMAPGPGGRGSLFWAELPLREVVPPAAARPVPRSQASSQAPSQAAPPVAPRGRRILVVDDVALNRLVVQALLEPAAFDVVMAGSGQEAIDLLALDAFDLVLMDVQMPGMDGLEATRRIRAAEQARPGDHRIAIVALTGEDMVEQVQACFAAGMDAHLAKPVDRAGLLATVRRMLLAGEEAPASLSGAA